MFLPKNIDVEATDPRMVDITESLVDIFTTYTLHGKHHGVVI